ncbi:MAG: copper amine oxidase N-terminal domain-containing protein [Capsulimonadaceae bacterium]
MNREKNIRAATAAMVAAVVLWPAASAAADVPVSIDVNGAPILYTGASPIETNGVVLAPFRAVFEAMGASVYYNPVERTIHARKLGLHIVLPLGSRTAYVDGLAQDLSQPAEVVNGSALVPLRFVAESLGATVQWQPDTDTVAILTNDAGTTKLAAYTATSSAPEVTGFDIDENRSYHIGDVLHARLTGSPGGQAFMTIPGVVNDVPMNETAPGIYRADVDIPNGLAVNGTTAVATLTVNGYRSPLVQAPKKLVIDSVTPQITAESPMSDSTIESRFPLIYAALSDSGGMGIDTRRTRIYIDGTDVTGDAMVAQNYIDVKPSMLTWGPHTIQVNAVDQAGNSTADTWKFNVTPQRLITSFRTDIEEGTVLNAGSTIRFVVFAQPDGQASVSILGIRRDIPLVETEPGKYVGSTTILNGQNVTEAPMTAQFTSADNAVASATLPFGLNVAAGAPDAPQITSPADGEFVRGGLHVAGTAAPNSTVRVTVSYKSALLGGILPVTGNAGTREVVADESGRWSVDNLATPADNLLGTGRDTQYDVSAVAVAPSGTRSPEALVLVQQGRIYAHRTGDQ